MSSKVQTEPVCCTERKRIRTRGVFPLGSVIQPDGATAVAVPVCAERPAAPAPDKMASEAASVPMTRHTVPRAPDRHSPTRCGR